MPPQKLIIIRGPSGSGKTSTDKELRLRAAEKTAVIEQDYLRRHVLKEKDVPGGVNIALIAETVQFCLRHGYHVILEGILDSRRYREMLVQLIEDHDGPVHAYYFDIPFDETLRRHAGKQNAHEFGEEELRRWWRANDLLGVADEKIIQDHLSFEQTVAKILQETGL